jgi:hypothetical protein
MAEYTTKPAQFRFPKWAHEFLAEEASATGTSKTEVLVEALSVYKRGKLEDAMREGYLVLRDEMLEEVREWDDTLLDGIEDDEW